MRGLNLTSADVIAGNALWSCEESDALSFARSLPDACVNSCVTSPPYFGLRDYGTARWDGGEPDCDHAIPNDAPNGNKGQPTSHPGRHASRFCTKCGAFRIDQQMGMEETPEKYVAGIVELFREVRRVLREDGTLWLNIGDSYANDAKWGGSTGGKHAKAIHGDTGVGRQKQNTGLKPKDLIGIPWMLAFALRADGWYLRSDIIWAKPNPMPESVTDRPTKSHEYVFLFSKAERYYYDAAAIAEPCTDSTMLRIAQPNLKNQKGSDRVPGKTNGPMKAVVRKPSGGASFGKQNHDPTGTGAQSRTYERPVYQTRNKRSVWTINTKSYKGAHFATMPLELAQTCIRAGCPAGGIVYEPFTGSGTTLGAAVSNGRRAIGCELNPDYIELCKQRMANVTPPLFTDTTEAA